MGYNMNRIEFYSSLKDYEGAIVTGLVTGVLIISPAYIDNHPIFAIGLTIIGFGLFFYFNEKFNKNILARRNIEPSKNPIYVVRSRLKLVKDYTLAIMGGIVSAGFFAFVKGNLGITIAEAIIFLLIGFSAVCVAFFIIDKIGKCVGKFIKKMVKEHAQ